MLSNNSDNHSGNNPSEPPASPSMAGAADSVPFLNPGSPIEVASSGNGTTIDPSGKDKPPAACASDSSSPEA